MTHTHCNEIIERPGRMQSMYGYVHPGSNVHKELHKVFLLRSTECLLSSGMSVGVRLLFIICTFLQLMTPAFGKYLLFIY